MPRWTLLPFAVVALALLAWALEPNAYPSYDYAFALSAAQDVFEGRTTGYDVPLYSPVPHTLTLALALVTVPLPGTMAVFTAVALLFFGALCVAVFEVGRRLGGWPVGALAAVVVFTSPEIFELGVRTYGDVWFAALVVSALALELARPRRGWPVLVLLAFAGGFRPEGWALAGAYWVWWFPALTWRGRVGAAAVVVAAPVAWSVMDLALTGDPLHTMNHTETYTERARRIVSVDALWKAQSALVGWVVLAGAVPGFVLALRADRRRGLLVGLVAVGAFALTVAPAVIGQTPVLRRYLIVPGALCAVLFAYACVGWVQARVTEARPAPLPTPLWAAGGLALLLAAVVTSVGVRVDKWGGDRETQRARVASLRHLHEQVADGPPRAVLRERACRPIRTPGYAFRPYLRLWLDVPPRDVLFDRDDFAPDAPLLLLPRAGVRDELSMLGDLADRSRSAITSSPRFRREYRRVGGTERWDLFADAGCRRAVA